MKIKLRNLQPEITSVEIYTGTDGVNDAFWTRYEFKRVNEGYEIVAKRYTLVDGWDEYESEPSAIGLKILSSKD